MCNGCIQVVIVGVEQGADVLVQKRGRNAVHENPKVVVYFHAGFFGFTME
jgi:hypothetical protein